MEGVFGIIKNTIVVLNEFDIHFNKSLQKLNQLILKVFLSVNFLTSRCFDVHLSPINFIHLH